MVSQLATCKKPAHSHTNSPILHSATRNSDLVIIGAGACFTHTVITHAVIYIEKVKYCIHT